MCYGIFFYLALALLLCCLDTLTPAINLNFLNNIGSLNSVFRPWLEKIFENKCWSSNPHLESWIWIYKLSWTKLKKFRETFIFSSPPPLQKKVEKFTIEMEIYETNHSFNRLRIWKIKNHCTAIPITNTSRPSKNTFDTIWPINFQVVLIYLAIHSSQ
jgi:hypothetical protein